MRAKEFRRFPALSLVLTFALLIAALPARAQFDTLTDNDRCELGQIRFCRNSSNSQAEKEGGELPGKQQGYVATCPHLPPSVAVSGDDRDTHCQMVGLAGIGRMDLIERGFIVAVDVWNYVNGAVEVCFRNAGALVFLDATYLHRMLVDLESYERAGMTCGAIDRIGTVVLLEAAAPAADETSTALPTLDAIPQSDCQIKLMETLFLRAEPAGAIIGLVWLYSEVPVFEVNGDWYKIEFEGKMGYISREYRKVLWGNCV
ncbi:MAG: SH3 domain-containing protein [Chloroflexota bacterium]|nr:SH3 domain-containing protein [Chloroflexota bacterium]